GGGRQGLGTQRGPGFGADDAVGDEAGYLLKPADGLGGLGPVDAVDLFGVKAQRLEALLELDDVGAGERGGAQRQCALGTAAGASSAGMKSAKTARGMWGLWAMRLTSRERLKRRCYVYRLWPPPGEYDSPGTNPHKPGPAPI